MPSKPDPRLIPLLEKHEITWEEFSKRGRPPRGVRAKRASVVTELHSAGTSWADMMAITGLSNGAIQRLTQATGNPESKQNLRENAARVGHSLRGKKKPWLSKQMREAWADGAFDFHRGRVRPESEREALRAAWTPERRSQVSERLKAQWREPSWRESLLAFHRAPEERARRSRAQSRRMEEDPVMWTRGKGQYVDASKCTNACRFWVRSSYEVAAVSLLEEDTSVRWFTYEKPFLLDGGKIIKPDFLVQRAGNLPLLIEVKASWTLALPADHKISRRLALAKGVAESRGWDFEIWTERGELADAL